MDFKYDKGRIFLENEMGKTIAEVTYSNTSENTVNIYHTFVDRSLRGQGIAGKLMAVLVNELKDNNKKAVATCSYAIEWFENHPEYSDIYFNDTK